MKRKDIIATLIKFCFINKGIHLMNHKLVTNSYDSSKKNNWKLAWVSLKSGYCAFIDGSCFTKKTIKQVL